MTEVLKSLSSKARKVTVSTCNGKIEEGYTSQRLMDYLYEIGMKKSVAQLKLFGLIWVTVKS